MNVATAYGVYQTQPIISISALYVLFQGRRLGTGMTSPSEAAMTSS